MLNFLRRGLGNQTNKMPAPPQSVDGIRAMTATNTGIATSSRTPSRNQSLQMSRQHSPIQNQQEGAMDVLWKKCSTELQTIENIIINQNTKQTQTNDASGNTYELPTVQGWNSTPEMKASNRRLQITFLAKTSDKLGSKKSKV